MNESADNPFLLDIHIIYSYWIFILDIHIRCSYWIFILDVHIVLAFQY